MSGCICEGNWRKLVEEYEPHFDKVYRHDITGEYYIFYGLVWASDDLYFGMQGIKGNTKKQLLSCVGDIEGFGYTRMDE